MFVCVYLGGWAFCQFGQVGIMHSFDNHRHVLYLQPLKYQGLNTVQMMLLCFFNGLA